MSNGLGTGIITPLLDPNSLVVPSSRTVMDLDFFNTRFAKIATAINVNAAAIAAQQNTVATLVSAGLAQLNAVLTPYLTTLQEAATLGFLTAEADGLSISLTETEVVGFALTANEALFVPTEYVLAVDDTDSTNWGLIQVTSYLDGNLQGTVVYCTKTQVSTSWGLSCNAAVIPVMNGLLAACQAAEAATIGANDAVQASIVTLGDLIIEIQEGPVTSVCGYTGNVSLGISDISGLGTALLGKASTSTVQPISAILTAIAALTLTTNQIIVATGTSSFIAIALSPFMQTVLAATTAAAVLATLGAAPLSVPINEQVGTSYLLALSDNGGVVRLTNGSSIVCSLPNSLPKGFNCMVEQGGAGQVTFTAASGATINNRLGQTRIAGQFGTAGLYVRSNADNASAIYNLSGDTA